MLGRNTPRPLLLVSPCHVLLTCSGLTCLFHVDFFFGPFFQALEASSKREATLREQLDGNQKDADGMLESLYSLEASVATAKQRESEVLAREAAALARAEAADLLQARTSKQLDVTRAEADRLRAQVQQTASEMRQACEADVQAVYRRGKEKESELAADIAAAEKRMLTMQLQIEQLQRQLVTSQEQAHKVSAVCEVRTMATAFPVLSPSMLPHPSNAGFCRCLP